ncbi:MAG TPA: DUF2628 domain-containing protein [Persephonella sp.]|uniref:DUF2628 domain-containing protein n=1 Tax=Persephonella marina (strain DSM 14350 / EX-H1) TaxID=123214 RepID=C0QTA1_PERMH|nr:MULTISPECIES: DUF2628 domain-containing protein [Persephonella]ACO03033.1 conserved hypothetical protein [Persephonella marina EX-H1]HCB70465.1 DUF2628 domain-containing protein [Persephonella sp.]
MENISTEEIKAFVGEKSDYYIKKFEKFEKGGSISWNWSAFFFGVLWMFYRKMYLYGTGIFLGILFLNIILEILKVNPVVSTGVSLWLWIGFGMFGNYIYYIFVINSIKKLKKQFHSEEQFFELLKKKGGVNKLILYIFGALGLIYLLLLVIYMFNQ